MASTLWSEALKRYHQSITGENVHAQTAWLLAFLAEAAAADLDDRGVQYRGKM